MLRINRYTQNFLGQNSTVVIAMPWSTFTPSSADFKMSTQEHTSSSDAENKIDFLTEYSDTEPLKQFRLDCAALIPVTDLVRDLFQNKT